LKRPSFQFDCACFRLDDPELTATGELDNEREKLKKFVALRQDLERVRNLCYMVSRREKLQRSFVKLREQVTPSRKSFFSSLKHFLKNTDRLPKADTLTAHNVHT
jgi:hypothetical protein